MNCCVDTRTILGGTSKQIRATFTNEQGYPFDLQNHTIYFTLTDMINLNSSPIVRKEAAIFENGGSFNVAVAKLTPADTVELAGKYRYRFTVLDTDGSADAIEGDIIIKVCTDKEAIV